MRVKNRLIIFVLVLSLVPVIILWIYQNKCSQKLEMDNYKKTISTMVEQKNSYLDEYFKNIEDNAAIISKNENMLKAAQVAINNKDKSEKDAELEELVNDFYIDIKTITDNNSSIINIILLNSKNETVLSANQNEIQVASQLGDKINLDNNFSEFFMTTQYVNNFPAFAYITNLYSDTKQLIGKIVYIFNTFELQTILKGNNLFDSSSMCIVDFNGNVVEFPFTSISNFKSNYKYAPIQSKISSALNNNEDLGFVKYKVEKIAKISYIKPLNSYKAAIISTTNQSAIAINTKKINTHLMLLNITFIIIITSLGIGFIHYFTKPLNSIVLALNKINSGDNYVRINVKSKDEFAMIAKSFNNLISDLSESEERYKTINEMNNNIVFEYNIPKNHVSFSKNYNKMFSHRPKTDRYEDSFFANAQLHPDDVSKYKFKNKIIVSVNKSMQGEYRFKTIYGSYVWFLIKTKALYDENQKPYKIVGIMVDIDNAKKSERILLKRAEYDSLTGLFNRETFIKQLANEFELSKIRRKTNAVLFIDIDDFKKYNDTYNHACGDEVLKFISDTIKKKVEDCGFAGRYGGDEFIVCLNAFDAVEEIEVFAKSIIKALKDGFDSKTINEHISVDCSIGISLFSETGNNFDTIIDEADEAMYKVKKHGKGNYSIYKTY